MRRFGIVAAACALAMAPAAAQDAPVDRSNDLAWMNAQQAYLASLQPQDGWYAMDGGLRWRYIDYKGSDRKPRINNEVTVHYEGRFIDGEVFDSSYERGEPATFPLHRLIEGWQMAIPQMGVGDTIEIAVPSNLGYGPRGKGPIPGGATLVFKVELIDFAQQ